jgi:hypothetical protein
MNKSELRKMIRETIEDVRLEAKANAAPSGATYTFNQLNKLMKSKKAVVLIKNEYDGEMIVVSDEDGFFMQENDDGDNTVHTTDGQTLYEYGAEFTEIYVAQKVNLK